MRPGVTVADPLSLWIAEHRKALGATRGPNRFNAGEHAWLGSVGAAAAVERLVARGVAVEPALFSDIKRRDRRESLQYGELVALSGDFYETPDDLFDERPSPLPWLWESDDLSDLRQIFAEELKWIAERRAGRTTEGYPDETVRLAWNAKSYVELALANDDHFGWHNVRAYCRHHAAAIALAVGSRAGGEEMFRHALYVNAFADHFLTDGFAAGHVRVPRTQIRRWAVAQGWNEQIAGALSKLLHDQDGHIDLGSLHGSRTGELEHADGRGLAVCNAAGTSFRTFCDGQLFLDGSDAGRQAIRQAVEAVAASVGELLVAWKEGVAPAGIYAATSFVPFPDPRAPRLIDKFPATASEEDRARLYGNVAWYTKFGGVQRQHSDALLRDLPDLMQRFREAIAQDAEDDGTTRIDPRYVAAFRHVA